jgi:hypothetical protein
MLLSYISRASCCSACQAVFPSFTLCTLLCLSRLPSSLVVVSMFLSLLRLDRLHTLLWRWLCSAAALKVEPPPRSKTSPVWCSGVISIIHYICVGTHGAAAAGSMQGAGLPRVLLRCAQAYRMRLGTAALSRSSPSSSNASFSAD